MENDKSVSVFISCFSIVQLVWIFFILTSPRSLPLCSRIIIKPYRLKLSQVRGRNCACNVLPWHYPSLLETDFSVFLLLHAMLMSCYDAVQYFKLFWNKRKVNRWCYFFIVMRCIFCIWTEDNKKVWLTPIEPICFQLFKELLWIKSDFLWIPCIKRYDFCLQFLFKKF